MMMNSPPSSSWNQIINSNRPNLNPTRLSTLQIIRSILQRPKIWMIMKTNFWLPSNRELIQKRMLVQANFHLMPRLHWTNIWSLKEMDSSQPFLIHINQCKTQLRFLFKAPSNQRVWLCSSSYITPITRVRMWTGWLEKFCRFHWPRSSSSRRLFTTSSST